MKESVISLEGHMSNMASKCGCEKCEHILFSEGNEEMGGCEKEVRKMQGGRERGWDGGREG